MKDINHQYDNIAKDFSDAIEEGNKDSREAFAHALPESLVGMKVLDLGCGNGLETRKYLELGAETIVGLDASRELLAEGREKYNEIEFKYGLFEDTNEENQSFDYVFSKYAIQTAKDLEPIWKEVHRVLKKDGVFMMLVTHPIRQFIEKSGEERDYFNQEIVDSRCFGETITFKEPTHTLGEYFSPFMLQNFRLEYFDERFDKDAEKIRDIYPGFMLLRFRKNN